MKAIETLYNGYKAIPTVYDGYKFRSRTEARWAVFFKALGIRYKYEMDGFDLDGTWYLPDFWMPDQQCWIEVKGQEPSEEEEEKADLLAIYTEKPVYIFHGDVWIPPVPPPSGCIYSDDKRSALECGRWYVVNIDSQDEDGNDIHLEVPPHILALFHLWRRYSVDVSIHASWNLPCSDLVITAPLQILQQVYSKVKPYEEELLSLLSGWDQERFRIEGGNLHGHYWCECPKCHLLGIGFLGNSLYLPCECVQKEYASSRKCEYVTYKSPRLIAAYIAARQARFEHGENGGKHEH